MSELKEHLFVPYSELQEGDELTDAITIAKSYYLKSEVDEVITRHKEKLIEQITLRVWAELQLRHNKYKRCLNNAESCQYKSWFYYEKHYEDKARKMWKWQHRWLDLAKLFNPNN